MRNLIAGTHAMTFAHKIFDTSIDISAQPERNHLQR